MRPARTIGVLMVAAGLLLLGSAAAALLGTGADNSSRAELASVLGPARASIVATIDPREAGRLRARAAEAAVVGEVRIPAANIAAPLVRGAEAGALRRGPAIYDGSPFPGEGGTVAIAGHRTTHGAPFRHLDRVRAGDAVVLVMPYGSVRYRVRQVQIVDPGQVQVIRRVAGPERLVLTTCHPLFSADRRLVVTARRTALS